MLAGDIAEAARSASRALETARARREQGNEAWALRLLGDVAANQEPANVEAAESSYRQAALLADELGMRPLVAHCHLGLAKVYRRAGRRQAAREHQSNATAMFREMSMPFWLARAEAETEDPSPEFDA